MPTGRDTVLVCVVLVARQRRGSSNNKCKRQSFRKLLLSKQLPWTTKTWQILAANTHTHRHMRARTHGCRLVAHITSSRQCNPRKEVQCCMLHINLLLQQRCTSSSCMLSTAKYAHPPLIVVSISASYLLSALRSW